jgi:hypothetical protein
MRGSAERCCSRRRYPERQDCWHVYYGDVQVGTIARRAGCPVDAWISHRSTKWVVKSAIDFLKEFEQRADLSDRTKWDLLKDLLTA